MLILLLIGMFRRYHAQLFEWFVLSFYRVVFWIVALKHRRTFTPLFADCETTLTIGKDEWALEEKQDEDELITLEGSSFAGDTSLFISLQSASKTTSASLILLIDGRTLTTEPIIARKSAGDEHTFLAGPLRFELRKPFRKWRVQFKGMMRDSESGESVYVVIGGWWNGTSDARWRYSKLSIADHKDAILSRPWDACSHICTVTRLLNCPDLLQWGELHCEISIGNGDSRTERLRGLRSRLRAPITGEQQLSAYIENGSRVLWSRRQDHQGGITNGFICRGDQKIVGLQLKDDVDSDRILDISRGNEDSIEMVEELPFVLSKTSPPSSHTIELYGGGSLIITRVGVRHLVYSGVAVFVDRKSPVILKEIPELPPIPEYSANGAERCLPLLPFTHRACQDSSLTGGKAANLARLTTIANGFVVPRGVAVTVAAFTGHLERHGEIARLVGELGRKGLSLDACISLGEEIGRALEGTVLEEAEALKDMVREEVGGGCRFAVRSSAVGEDGADLSSAGQLESYMDVELDEIPSKVAQCWASNYRREVINYRRQHGQPLTPPMGVVVQRMIENGVAGVMFTCDPVRGDPSRVVINAFKGKGEEIVSGAVTPDTIVLRKGDRSVIEEPSPCCLSPSVQQSLLSAALYLEETFGGPQDVEFIVDLANDRVNVVQSRDVTGRDRESPFEQKTEFNSALLTDRECFTMANIGEVVPTAVTPLFISYAMKVYDAAIMKGSEACAFAPRHYPLGFALCNNRILFNHGELFLRIWEVTKKDRLPEICFGGQLLFTDDMINEGMKRYPRKHPLFPLRRMFKMIKMVLVDSYNIRETAHRLEKELHSLVRGSTPRDRLENFVRQKVLYSRLIGSHSAESMFSAFTYILVGMLVRGKEDGEFTSEMLSDIASLFANGNASGAISGDVPNSLMDLASALRKDGISVEELDETESGLAAIKNGKTSGPLLDRFMQLHGHRGPGELTFIVRSWASQPALLVHTIRGMLAVPSAISSTGEVADIDTLVDRLKCKPRGMRRRLMKYLIKQTYRGVAFREECKDLLVRGTGHVRANIDALGEQLVEEGFLPSSDLTRFFTESELVRFVEARSPKLISRAMRRRKQFADFEGLRYDYIIHGIPKEIPPPSSELLRETSLTGTTVCEGVVVARARVALTIDEAHETQPGEILITRYTDICWSPLFPIVKGIVTEVGGLLSHGAVVAREYGLPSLIAVGHATDVFNTGDLVELNATAGTISKVSQTAEKRIY